MLVNIEQNNTIEGTYLKVINIDTHLSTVKFNAPEDFYLNENNIKNWVIGWGNDSAYYNAGVENIRELVSIDNNTLQLGSLKRGSGFPIKGQKIAFWNKTPSGFSNKSVQSVLDTHIWPEFAGESIAFSDIKFDSILDKWILIANECDTSKIQIYAAMSADLIHWEDANNGNPLFTPSDFSQCEWAGYDITGSRLQTPFVSDIVRHNHKWYLFMDGYDSLGKRHIGVAISSNTLLGNFEIWEYPILKAGYAKQWNNKSSFCPKIEKYKDGFVMFYDGRNTDNVERIGMATSDDLIHWNNSAYNPVIDQHTGWRSKPDCTEPAYIEVREDTIMLLIAGVKKFNTSWIDQHIFHNCNKGKLGNVDDAQLGFYITTDEGKTFFPHRNNPVFINDYSNPNENEHLGGNFTYITTDSLDYIFHQAKTSHKGSKYSLMLRTRESSSTNSKTF